MDIFEDDVRYIEDKARSRNAKHHYVLLLSEHSDPQCFRRKIVEEDSMEDFEDLPESMTHSHHVKIHEDKRPESQEASSSVKENVSKLGVKSEANLELEINMKKKKKKKYRHPGTGKPPNLPFLRLQHSKSPDDDHACRSLIKMTTLFESIDSISEGIRFSSLAS